MTLTWVGEATINPILPFFFTHAKSWGNHFLGIHNFPYVCGLTFTILLYEVFNPDFGPWTFFPHHQKSTGSLSQTDGSCCGLIFVLVILLCIFLFTLWVWACEFRLHAGGIFLPHSAEKLVLFPHECGLLLSFFDHVRAKNNSGITLLSLSCVSPFLVAVMFPFFFHRVVNRLIFVVCMQWLVFGLYGSGNEGLVCLINLVCLGAS